MSTAENTVVCTYSRRHRTVSYEEYFLRNICQVHDLKISDRLLRSKSFFQNHIPGFMCSVFHSARGGDGVG